MRGIAIREELTDEWKNRGAAEDRDFEILIAENFLRKPEDKKKFKSQ